MSASIGPSPHTRVFGTRLGAEKRNTPPQRSEDRLASLPPQQSVDLRLNIDRVRQAYSKMKYILLFGRCP